MASSQPTAVDVVMRQPLRNVAAGDGKMGVTVGWMFPSDNNRVHYVVADYHKMLKASGVEYTQQLRANNCKVFDNITSEVTTCINIKKPNQCLYMSIKMKPTLVNVGYQ